MNPVGKLLLVLAYFLAGIFSVLGQDQSKDSNNATRPRIVNQKSTQQATATQEQTPPQSTVGTDSLPAAIPTERANEASSSIKLSLPKFKTRKGEAERLLKSKPVPTAMGGVSLYAVTLVALDPQASELQTLTVSKDFFLSRGSETMVQTSLGNRVQLRIVRPNGVNTAVTIFNSDGRAFIPLLVEFPIERNGALREMAYYTSAHPALISPEMVKGGQAYVRNMLDLAAKRLQLKGITISPKIVDIAERLVVVEHVDHPRFNRENRLALYEEIFILFALNELETYKFAVSTAGAGGMVQMIPSTYQMVRRRHPGVGLNPDFFFGMRNHGNALEAMLLYMQDTWNDLLKSSDIQYVLGSKLATQEELVAAGYNSNPARLPLYIRRSAADWKTLIPRETQVYLQIYKSVDGLIPLKRRG